MKYKIFFVSTNFARLKTVSYFQIDKDLKSNCLDKLVFNPCNLGYLIFLVLINILYITSYYTIPFQIGSNFIFFEEQRYHEVAIDIIFLIDMILRFFASYKTEYGTISDFKSIVIHYLSNHFMIDCLSLFPGLLTFELYTKYKF